MQGYVDCNRETYFTPWNVGTCILINFQSSIYAKAYSFEFQTIPLSSEYEYEESDIPIRPSL